jgi:hypothetical protein
MLYRIDPPTDDLKLYREPHSGSKLPYRTVKEMRMLYPEGNFAIMGEIGGLARAPNDGDRLLLANGRFIPILPRGSLIKPFEWVAGYIAIGKNAYLAVVRSLIVIFSWR